MNSKGFTLIEILVVMVIFALAGTMVFANVGKSRLERSNRDFARSFVTMVKKARTRAIASGRPVNVRLSEETRKCTVDGMEKALAIPEELEIEAQEGRGRMEEGDFVFSFYPDGSSDGLELTFSVEEIFSRTVRIDMLTGIVTRAHADE